MTATRKPSLGNAPRLSNSAQTEKWMQRVTEILQIYSGALGDRTGLDRAVTFRDLANAGFSYTANSISFEVPTDTSAEEANTATPPAPQNLTASATTVSVYLQWDNTSLTYISHVEIFRAEANDLGQAVLVGTAKGALARDTVEPATTYYYWIRFVSFAGKVGAFNAVAGTQVTTSQDPGTYLELLSQAITESELDTDLQARIDLVDAPATGLVDQLTQEIVNRTDAITTVTGLANNAQSTATGAVTRLNSVNGAGKSIEALAAEVETLTATSGEDGALASSAYNLAAAVQTRIDNVDGAKTIEALATEVASISTDISDGATGLAAAHTRATTVETRLSDVAGTGRSLEVLGVDFNALTTSVSNLDSGITAVSDALGITQTQVVQNGDDITALSSNYSALSAELLDAEGDIQANATAISSAQSELVVVNQTLTAQANSIDQLGVDIGGNTAALQAESVVRASETGELYAQYSLKADLNGYVAGWGFSSTANTYNSQVHSEMVFRVDTFAVGAPGANQFTLVVDGNNVVMDGAYIRDASITSAKIESLIVDKVVGDIATFIQLNVNTLQSTNFNSVNKTGWRLNVNGAHEIYGGPGSAVWASNLRADAVEVVDAINLKPYAVTIWTLVQETTELNIPTTTDPSNETLIYEAYVDFTDAYADSPLQIVSDVVAWLQYSGNYNSAYIRINLYRNGVVIWGTDIGINPNYPAGINDGWSVGGGLFYNSSDSEFIVSGLASNLILLGPPMGIRFTAGHDDIFVDYPGPGIHHYELRFCGGISQNSTPINSQWKVPAGSRWIKFDGGKK